MIARALACILASGLASACGSAYETVQIDVIDGSSHARASAAAIMLVEGRILTIDARPVAATGHDEYDVLDRLQLESDDPGIVQVRKGVVMGTWVFSGVAPGVTSISVRVNGEREDRIPVKVVAQP